MPRILYGVSPVGLGHATRALAVVDELRQRGTEVRVFTGGRPAEFLRRVGYEVDDIVDDAVPRVVGGEMSRVALWYVRSWLAQRRNVKRAGRLFDEYKPDLIVCDEEFSGVTVASKRGIKRVFVADELELGFARTWIAGKIEGRVERWYKGLLASVDLLIIPEAGKDHGNRRYVGPIVRKRTMGCAEVREKFGLPAGEIILFSMSGSGLGRELGEKLVSSVRASRPDANVVVTGNRGPRMEGSRVYDLGVVVQNQDVVACADLVVSTAGKSTIDEASAAGTPLVVIPIRHHAEQERNAAALGYSFEDGERLSELVGQKIGRRETPREYPGEQIASRLILSLV